MKTLVSMLRPGAAVFLLLLACALKPAPCFAVGEAGAQFLKIGVGAKANAMGEAFVALADDPSAIYWNPAGLSRISSAALQGSYFKWFESMSYQHLVCSFPTQMGSIAVAVARFSSGDIPLVDTELTEIGTYDAYDLAATVAYSNRVAGDLSYGIGVKLIRSRIEDETATGFAADFGALVKVPRVSGLTLGAAVLNVGPDIKFIQDADPLPLVFRGGAAYGRGPLTCTVEVSKPRDNDPSLHVGGEGVIAGTLALRAGFMTRPEMDSAFTGGVGIQWRGVRASYAFVPFEEIQDTHRLSVQVGL